MGVKPVGYLQSVALDLKAVTVKQIQEPGASGLHARRQTTRAYYLPKFLRFFFREMANASNLQNGTETETSFQELSSSECISWLTVFMAESVAIVTLNFLTVFVFIRNRSLRKRSMYLVINLAVADMLVGGCSEITHFVSLGESCSFWNAQQLPFVYLVYVNMRRPFLAASLTSLVAISLERMHATFRPFKDRIIKKWVFGFIITIIWVTSGLSLFASYYLNHLFNHPESCYYGCGSFICFCLFVVCVSYASIFVKISCGAHPQRHGASSKERKLTKTLFIVTLVSLLMWFPFTIYSLLLATFRSFLPWRVIRHLYHAFAVLYYANSLINPILYAIRMPDFKRALISLFRRRQQRRIEIIPHGLL